MIPMRKLFHIGGVFWVSCLLCGCGEKDPVRVTTGESMGTTYRIKTFKDAAPVMPEIEAMLDQLTRDLSTWRSESWVGQFNRAGAGTTMVMPESVRELLELSKTYHERAEGRFDPTIGAMIRVWGFGAWRRDWQGTPTEAEVAAARQASGFHHIRIEGEMITKLHDGMMLDFSAVAKGHAVDLMGGILRRAAINDFVIEFGGDILAGGHGPKGDGWVIGGRGFGEPVILRNEAIATSGSEFNFRGGDSHVIDPHLGRPVPVGRPVSAIAPTCAEADALATAMMVAEAVVD